MRKNVYVTPKSFLCLIDFYKVLYVGGPGMAQTRDPKWTYAEAFLWGYPYLIGLDCIVKIMVPILGSDYNTAPMI